MTDILMKSFSFIGVMLSALMVASLLYSKLEERRATKGLPPPDDLDHSEPPSAENAIDKFRNLASEVIVVQDSEGVGIPTWRGVECLSVSVPGSGVTRYLKMGPAAYRYGGSIGFNELTQLVAVGALDNNTDLILHLATIAGIEEKVASNASEKASESPGGRVRKWGNDMEDLAREYDAREQNSTIDDSAVDDLVRGVEDSIKGDEAE